MATTKNTKAKPTYDSAKIADAYVKYLLIEGARPHSVFQFADSLGISEADFYKHYSGFDALEASLWSSFMEDTLQSIKRGEAFDKFTAREKLLTFYYAHLEILRLRRSFFMLRWPDMRRSPRTPRWLKEYKEKFMEFARELIAQGIEEKEIKERPYLSERYYQGLWLQLIFVLDYWKKDISPDFENSDAAIEKAVDLSFQLLGSSAFDSAIDLAKFIWQSR